MRKIAIALTPAITWASGALPFFAALLLWQRLGTDTSSQFPRPSTWFASLSDMLHSGALLPALTATVWILLVSLAVASLAGFVLGVLMGISAGLRDWCSLLLEYFRAIPPPVLIPVIVLMLGYSDLMEVVVIGLAGVWPVLLNTISGTARTQALTFDVARSLRLSRSETIIKVIIPGTMPALLLGIRVAVPHVIIITLVVEMFTGAAGVGSLMMAAERNFNAPAVFGLLVLVGGLGLALAGLFAVAERLILLRWPVRA